MRFPALLLAAILLAGQTPQPSGQPVPVRPRIVGMPHVALRVHDIEASRRFYKDFLGFSEPFSIVTDGKLTMTFIKISDRQYIELSPESKPTDPRFVHLALETDDAAGLRSYVQAHGYKVSDKPPARGRIGNIGTSLTDPDGNVIDVTQYTPDGESMMHAGKDMPPSRISTHILHVGFYVSKPETAKYYIDLLGFREFWRASADGKTAIYSNLFVPEGKDYIEFELGPPPTAARYGTVYHIALEVPDMEAAIAKLNANPARASYTKEISFKVGRNHIRQCNLFDPDGTRVELMEDHTADGMPSPMANVPMFAR